MDETGRRRATATPESRRDGNWRAIAWMAFTSPLALCVIAGCGGIVTIQNTQIANIAIQVSPSQATLAAGESKHFVATVSGTNDQSITWSLATGSSATSAQTTTGANLGTISQDGIYVAPAGMATSVAVEIIATSTVDPTKSKAVPITVTPVTLTVTPVTASVETGASQPFAAIVTGLTNHDVTWAVNGVIGGDSTLGTISANGVYIAPPADPGIVLSVSATSIVENQLVGNATVSVSTPAILQQRTGTYYGSGLQFDVLDNLQVAEGDVDYRFRAMASGALSSFLWYDVYVRGGATAGCSGVECECDGYGCGTGGSIEACIYSDDGTSSHLPTDSLTQKFTGLETQPLACVGLSNLRTGPAVRTETFLSPPELVAGTIYHLHWHNSDPNPAANFVSVDDDCVWHPTVPRQPTIPDTDLAAMSIYYNGAKVVVNVVPTDTPIFQLNYANGTAQGQGYIGSWIGAPVDISGASEVRELLTLSGSNRNVTGVSVRVNRVTGANPLTVILATGDGNVIEQGEIPASHFPSSTALTEDATASKNVTPVWGSYTFSSSHLLTAGQSYQLILSAPEDTRYQTYGIEKGQGYNFTASTYFNDGYGQFSIDNGQTWTGLTQPNGTPTGSRNHTNADIQFYFTTE